MAFSQPNAQRELTNRKILEDLQLKKQLLLKQGVQPTLNPSSLSAFSPTNVASSDGHSMSSAQRAALQTANAQSMGYFIGQDSSFGNLILPVLPRFDNIAKMFPCMKLRHLQSFLEQIDGFEKPKILLEQYITPPHLASHMLFTIQSQYGDITGKFVGDLGSGCGALALGAAVLDAGLVIGFEIDLDAINIFKRNIEFHELRNVDAVQCDVVSGSLERWEKKFDTIILNPPFGTKHNAGMDTKFLKAAFNLAGHSVYSLHKTSTRAFILKTAESCGAVPEVLAELRYNISAAYKFHKKDSVDIEVEFFRFTFQ